MAPAHVAAIKAAVTSAFSVLTDVELHEMVMSPYRELRKNAV